MVSLYEKYLPSLRLINTLLLVNRDFFLQNKSSLSYFFPIAIQNPDRVRSHVNLLCSHTSLHRGKPVLRISPFPLQRETLYSRISPFPPQREMLCNRVSPFPLQREMLCSRISSFPPQRKTLRNRISFFPPQGKACFTYVAVPFTEGNALQPYFAFPSAEGSIFQHQRHIHPIQTTQNNEYPLKKLQQ